MNRNDNFDDTLEAWLRRQAPSQAPDQVLDAALDRVATQSQSQKRSWLHRFIGGNQMATLTRVAAVTAVVAIAALIGLQLNNLTGSAGGSPSPNASIPAEPTASAPAEPTTSPTPSAGPSSPEPSGDPSAAALVLRLEGGNVAGRIHLLTVLEDGRIITSDQGRLNPPVERRLTAAGVQLLRDELDATGLTNTSADYLPVAKPGVEPPAYDGAGSALEVGLPGGGTAVITWVLFGDDGLYFEPQPEAQALSALAARLSTLDQWLPASAWADAIAKPYTPARYRIFILTQQWGGSLDGLPVESATVSWPLDKGIDAFGDDIQSGTDELRCGLVDAEQATAVIQALQAAGATPSDQTYLSFGLGERATSRLISITLVSILPLAETNCEGAALNPL